jgi:hypothetical protein
MKRMLTLLVVLLGSCSGCAALEDLVLGPDPYGPEYGTVSRAANGCGNAAAYENASQTQEPELLQVQK